MVAKQEQEKSCLKFRATRATVTFSTLIIYDYKEQAWTFKQFSGQLVRQVYLETVLSLTLLFQCISSGDSSVCPQVKTF